MLATSGLEQELVEHFKSVSATSNTSCGKALANNERIFIDYADPNAKDPDGSLRRHVEAGYLTAQSTPLITRTGKAIGMITTHWRRHQYRLSERELRFLDLLARQAADLIVQLLAKEELQLNMDELTRFNDVMVSRESRMIELKEEVNSLHKKLGEPEKYPLNFGGGGRK